MDENIEKNCEQGAGGMTGADKDERHNKRGLERDTQLGVKDFTEDNLSKEQAVVYFRQMGPKWHKRETRE